MTRILVPIGPAPCDPADGGLSKHPTLEARNARVADLKALGFNYFVGFVDVDRAAPYGLSCGYAVWAGKQGYAKDLHGLIH